MQSESLRAFEERLFRQRSEAYNAELRNRAEQVAKERKESIAERPQTWADRQAARHAERFQARYDRFMQRKQESPTTEEGVLGELWSSQDGSL